MMERLTFDGNFCEIAQCRELPCPYNTACTQRQVWEKLRAYEDSGLTPSDVRSLWGEWNAMISALNSIGGGYERLRQLAEADKAGRLVVLPCKAGDELWTFCNYPAEQVYSFTVTDISTLNGRTMLNTSRCGVIDARDVGKTVFPTREEAEAALRRTER